MTTTTTVDCPASVWTQISTGSANVTAQLFSATGAPIGFRIVVADTAPDNEDASLGLVSTPANGGFAGRGLSAGVDNVYVRPLSVGGVAQVMAS